MEEELTPHSYILAWKIPWTEEPGGLQSMASKIVRHNWVTKQKQEYIYIYILFHILFYDALSQDIECDSLCYTVGSCFLSILRTYKSTDHKLSIYCPLVFGNNESLLYVWESVSVLLISPFVLYFRFTYKWCHMVFVFLFLTSLSMTISRSIHVAGGKGKFSQEENYQILLL